MNNIEKYMKLLFFFHLVEIPYAKFYVQPQIFCFPWKGHFNTNGNSQTI